MNIQKQLFRLYSYEFFCNFGLAQVIWVVLMAGRGFTLGQIGVAEGFFHLVSFLGEVPSGMAADLLGRKRTLAAASGLRALAAFCMIAGGQGMAGVCLSFAFLALSYNMASGTREALAYDSLLQAGCPQRYEQVSARQSGIWRATSAVCSLLTVLTLWLGWRRAYLVDGCFALAALAIACRVQEPVVTQAQAARQQHALRDLWPRLRRHIALSVGFLRQNPRAGCKMLADGALGCCATLTVMVLQQHLVQLGLGGGVMDALLGPALLAITLAGVAGSVCAVRVKLPFGRVTALCAGCIAAGVALAGAPRLSLALAGGALATFWDALYEIKVSVRLNQDFPSDQRATLVSVQSVVFSLLMLPASPLVGAVCEAVGVTAGLALLGAGLAAGAAVGFALYTAALRRA